VKIIEEEDTMEGQEEALWNYDSQFLRRFDITPNEILESSFMILKRNAG